MFVFSPVISCTILYYFVKELSIYIRYIYSMGRGRSRGQGERERGGDISILMFS